MAVIATAQITSAVTNEVQGEAQHITGKSRLDLVAKFTAVAPDSPCTATAYVQTSLDGGTTWYDIAAFQFAGTSGAKYLSCDGGEGVSAAAALTTGSLTANTAIDGLVGTQIRYVLTTTGSYGTGTELSVAFVAH